MKFNSKNEKTLYWLYRMSRKEWSDYNPKNNATTIDKLFFDLNQWQFIPVSKYRELLDAHDNLAKNIRCILRTFDLYNVLKVELQADLNNIFLYDITPVQAVNKYRKFKQFAVENCLN